jgi:thioredoxin 1
MNKSEFQQKVSESSKPVIVDFWAGWCAPCMVSKPVLEKLADEYAEQVEFMAVNADESHDVLEQFRIFGIPTVITFRDGKEAGRITGSQAESNYRIMFESLTKGGEVKIPLSTFDRALRLGAGAVFVMAGISTGNWLIAGIGGILAIMGVYDRCPLWSALAEMIQRK